MNHTTEKSKSRAFSKKRYVTHEAETGLSIVYKLNNQERTSSMKWSGSSSYEAAKMMYDAIVKQVCEQDDSYVEKLMHGTVLGQNS